MKKEIKYFCEKCGKEFSDKQQCLDHEKECLINSKRKEVYDRLKKVPISLGFNNLNGELIYLNTEEEIKLYEQYMCDGDNKTWGSWVSKKEKFTNLPKWIYCCFEKVNYNDEYIAYYFTLNEMQNKMEEIKNIINSLK